jgi:hypothetical protein
VIAAICGGGDKNRERGEYRQELVNWPLREHCAKSAIRAAKECSIAGLTFDRTFCLLVDWSGHSRGRSGVELQGVVWSTVTRVAEIVPRT